MKKILLLVLMILAVALPAFAETEMQRTNRMMVDCIKNQLCYKADAQRQAVWVNEYAWRTAYFDDKANISNFFLAYTKARKPEAAYVDIRSATSNKVIGQRNPFGYKDK